MANQYTKNGQDLIIYENYLIRGNTKINMQEVYIYYIVENHSRKETEKYFNLTPRMFEKIRDTLKIKKSRLLSYEHNKKTLKTLYGDEHYNNHHQQVQTCLTKYGVENVYQAESIKAKCIETKIERYGDEHFVNPEQTKKTCLEKYGYESINQIPEIKERKKQTCLKHFGVEYPMQSKEVKAKYDFESLQEKAFETKKKNGTTNSSKIQDWFISELKQIYGEADVETEYKEERYPYHCDAYIKSLDQFIELNIYFTHGGHPYNKDSLDDQAFLNRWIEKSKTSKFFYNAIKIWTKQDPEKQLCAKQNKLNYIMFYTEQEVKDFIKTLKETNNA